MLRGQKIIVIGLGITGLSCVRWLINAGAEVSMADSRLNPCDTAGFKMTYPNIPLYLGPLQAEVLQEYDLIVCSPGVPQSEPALVQSVKAGIPVVGDIEIFAQHIKDWSSQVIAITGSNGKSTVTTMVGNMAREAGLQVVVAGNIGTPVLDALLALEAQGAAQPDIFVLELSSFQLESTFSLNAAAATVLNVSEDHLDRYESMKHYAQAKARIFQGQGIMLLNRQDPFCVAMAKTNRDIRWFGQDAPRTAAEYGLQLNQGKYVLQQGNEVFMHLAELTIAGLHNAANALAAIALCEAVGMPRAPLLRGLKNFTGLAHRLQQVAVIEGVTYYDDSKGTNVGSTEAALKGMIQPVILIAGGQGKGQDFAPLKVACKAHCRLVILLGQDAVQIEAALENVVPVIHVKTVEDAVNLAAEKAKPNEVVLLSPACASLDMFVDYKQRGAAFVAAVKKLEGAL
jgi:UDP-N-acetylmuramoylalanine--D-glutamate ligase